MDNNELTHYGIKGMHWGIRRFQNPDGTRTAAGRERERQMYGRVGSGNGRFEAAKRARQNLKNVKSEENKHYKEWISRARKKDLTEEEGDAYDRKADEYAEKRKKARQEYRDTLREINKEILAEIKKADQKAKTIYDKGHAVEEQFKYDVKHPIKTAVKNVKAINKLHAEGKAARREYVDNLREIIREKSKHS